MFLIKENKGRTLNKYSLVNLNLFLVIISLQFYLYRTVIQEFKYLFVLTFATALVSTFFLFKRSIINSLYLFIKNLSLPLSLFIILLLANIATNKIYIAILLDSINAVIIIVFLLLLFINISSVNKLQYFQDLFLKSTFFIAVIIFIYNSTSSFFQSNDIIIDYNFALLPYFFALIYTISLLKNRNYFYSLILNLILVAYTISIYLSGSRRGVILLGVVITLIIISHLLFFLKSESLQKLRINTKLYLLLCITIFMSTTLFLTYSSCSCQNKILYSLPLKDPFRVQTNLYHNIYRYHQIGDKKASFTEFLKSTKINSFDDKDPNCGWGIISNYQRVSLNTFDVKLSEESNLVGARIDSNCYHNRNLYKSVIDKKFKTDTSKYLKLELYCYVSPNFDGKKVGWRVNVKNHVKNKSEVLNSNTRFYDLNKKGTWQKLSLEVSPKTEETPVFFSIKANRTKSFEGFIIIAYPNYTSKELLEIGHRNNMNRSKLTNARYFNNEYLRLNNNLIIAQATMVSFNFNTSILTAHQSDTTEGVNNLFKIDTTFFPYNENLTIDTLHTKFAGPRINRWRFSWQIYNKEYSLTEKLIGGGFDYLSWFGYYFYQDKTRDDWPHSPFLSVLLYSGILGLILYLYVIVKAIRLYFRYINHYKLLFIFFAFTFYFSVFSSNSPFTPPLFGFFTLLPFLIDYIHKNDKKTKRVS